LPELADIFRDWQNHLPFKLSDEQYHAIRDICACRTAKMQGGKWNGRGVGSWGDVGSFSFQQSKTLSSGEGGICLTNDDDLAAFLVCDLDVVLSHFLREVSDYTLYY
jgi:DegT/DnrJ/EryC1/StrS aminotransferase family